MVPVDMNIIKGIHGGQILQLAEDAGQIAAIKHCYTSMHHAGDVHANGISPTSGSISSTPYMVRLNDLNFLYPIYVNQLVQARAEVVFASQHSLAVEIEITAENNNNASRRVTNRGVFWYANFNIDQRTQQFTIAKVPPLLNDDSLRHQKYLQIYNQQKKSRQTARDILRLSNENNLAIQNNDPKPTTPVVKDTAAASKCVLIQSVLPSDCYENNYATGGFLMKLMDNAAGIACIKHCKCKISTISMSDVNFYKPVKLSNLAKAIGTLTFTSTNSAEIFTQVITEDIWTGQRDIVASAFFNFAILDKRDKVPPLVLTNDNEKRLFREGRQRYENRKKIRLKNKQ